MDSSQKIDLESTNLPLRNRVFIMAYTIGLTQELSQVALLAAICIRGSTEP